MRKKIIVPVALSLPVSILKSCGSPISSRLYPLLSPFSLSWSVASQHSARPADATSPADESLARLHGQRIRATRAWRGLDGSRSSCGTAANTGSAPISLHGDNIGRQRDGRALAATSNNLHSRQ